jgi:galactokinase
MSFQQIFGLEPKVEASAPGRVNLLGEHTDYNDGFVLPIAIPQQTTVQLGFSTDDRDHFYSQALGQLTSLSRFDNSPQGFSSYLYGCIQVLEQRGMSIPFLTVYITSSVPIGVGLSSSAALEVAMLRALRALLHLPLDEVQLAQLAQQAERQFAGVQCGILDQMAASLADSRHLLFLDTRTLDRQLLPLPTGSELLVLDSGIPRALADSSYNQRRADCEAAALQLGVSTLREIDDLTLISGLPESLQRRVRHVVTENQRVLIARQGISAEHVGRLMNASHASLRDDYQVSIAGLDTLVSLLQTTPGVFGAKLKGAGFGGACVALVAVHQAQRIADQVLEQYDQRGYIGCCLVP